MNTSIRFNHTNRTIEITKKFNKAASIFGSDEFKELMNAKEFAPDYKVVIKTVKRTNSMKGLNYNFMKKYIEQHDDEKQSIMAEYLSLSKKDEETGLSGISYGEVKAWFLTKYPIFEDKISKREQLIEGVRESRAAKKHAA